MERILDNHSAISCKKSSQEVHMRIVNLIHIGDQVLSLDDMDPMKKAEIALRLNEQSLKTLGYAAKKEKETA